MELLQLPQQGELLSNWGSVIPGMDAPQNVKLCIDFDLSWAIHTIWRMCDGFWFMISWKRKGGRGDPGRGIHYIFGYECSNVPILPQKNKQTNNMYSYILTGSWPEPSTLIEDCVMASDPWSLSRFSLDNVHACFCRCLLIEIFLCSRISHNLPNICAGFPLL